MKPAIQWVSSIIVFKFIISERREPRSRMAQLFGAAHTVFPLDVARMHHITSQPRSARQLHSMHLVFLVSFLVPDECPSTGPIEQCPTCCCESSDNIEFYDPDSPEPECTASSAVYEMTYNFTWNEVCHPGNYESYLFFTPIWSAPIAVSHNTDYRLWDACMDSVSVGVHLVSKNSLTGVIIQEFMAVGDDILEYVIADTYPQPTSKISQELNVDQDHPWVSVISAGVSTPDQFVGVADLCLCDGEEWKERVKVCFELFSTAAVSDRVAPEMQRNSVQGNSCSYGSIEFRFIEVLPLV